MAGELGGQTTENNILLQRATLNILEDINEQYEKSSLVNKATLNLLEDVNIELSKSEEYRRALLNMLEDFDAERIKAQQAKALFETVNKELEAFSYSVSHDLRAPLRAIDGFAQAVMEDYETRLDDEGKHYLRLIEENIYRMGTLIDDLLAFSRLSRQQMLNSNIDIEDMVKSVFNELLSQETDRIIEFKVGPLPPAHGDSSMIRQAVTNLLSNSIKFTRDREKAFIEIGCLQDPEECVYYVKDNGAGFDMKYADNLFKVFQRLHSAADFEGTGIGLALVHRIISRHGGRVWAEGKTGEGAVFYFALPE